MVGAGEAGFRADPATERGSNPVARSILFGATDALGSFANRQWRASCTYRQSGCVPKQGVASRRGLSPPYQPSVEPPASIRCGRRVALMREKGMSPIITSGSGYLRAGTGLIPFLPPLDRLPRERTKARQLADVDLLVRRPTVIIGNVEMVRLTDERVDPERVEGGPDRLVHDFANRHLVTNAPATNSARRARPRSLRCSACNLP